jgi:hypothetical protein
MSNHANWIGMTVPICQRKHASHWQVTSSVGLGYLRSHDCNLDHPWWRH